jgi:DNA-binding transcriptional LysR family regulator
MARNLDLSALRSLVTVAEAGGVTRAAGRLNLTQSAVSMQLKRLEEGMGLDLLDRTGRGVALTPTGELLVSYARRMLQLNDEALGRLTRCGEEGEIALGVPWDVVYPAIPQVLRRFRAAFPRIKVNLVSSYTRLLRRDWEEGKVDVILTTEDHSPPGAETLAVRPLEWVGAPGGQAWKNRPLRLAFSSHCIFRQPVQERLDDAGIPWELAVDTPSDRIIDANVSADLAVHVAIRGNEPERFEPIAHGGELPELWSIHINLYARTAPRLAAQAELVELIRGEYAASQAGARTRPLPQEAPALRA